MPIVRLLEDAEATGKAREVFDDIKATKGVDFVPNVWRSLAVDPDHLESCWLRVKKIMADGALDRRTKEIIAVAVSITNGCEYCVNSHSATLQKLGEPFGVRLEVDAAMNQQLEPGVIVAKPWLPGRTQLSKLVEQYQQPVRRSANGTYVLLKR